MYYNAYSICERMSPPSSANSKVASLHRVTPIPDGDFLLFLGKRVRQLRNLGGMTRRIVARQADVSERHLAQLEAGEGNVSIVLLRRIAAALNVSLVELFAPEVEEPAEKQMIQRFLERLPNHRLEDVVLRLMRDFSPGEKLRRKRIALIGLRGAGKSTLGSKLALEMRVPFIELDGEIEKETGMPLGEIFSLYGQAGYRAIERRTLSRVLSEHECAGLAFGGPVATLTMDVAEDCGIRPGYKLKLNSYDLGVDIELHDALQRIRFEHPEIRSVIITSAKNRIFCSGANIYMLGLSSHAWKVNFCKFTNETRNGIEDASAHSGLKFLAACNGTTAGGGYELALACDEIILVDDRSSAVSLPELPLLGVLPGTGGLTRVTDKRNVRRDHADIFCTNPDGVRGQRAKDWRLVDEIVKPQQFVEHIKQRARQLAERSDRPANAKGVILTPLERTVDDTGLHYKFVDVQYNREARTATLAVHAPEAAVENTLEKVLEAGANWWPLQMARELDDAILTLRSSELDLGLWLLKTSGTPDAVLATDAFLVAHQDNWFVREVLGMLRRTFARLDVTSRSLFAIIEPNSCFAGSLFELALAADRVYMRDAQEGEPATVALSKINFGALPMTNHLSRLPATFCQSN